jgi:hypothetical protein
VAARLYYHRIGPCTYVKCLFRGCSIAQGIKVPSVMAQLIAGQLTATFSELLQ